MKLKMLEEKGKYNTQGTEAYGERLRWLGFFGLKRMGQDEGASDWGSVELLFYSQNLEIEKHSMKLDRFLY